MKTAVIIAIAAVVLIGLFLALRSGQGRVDSATAKELVASGATLVDVRTPGEFKGGHIDGARNIPVAEISGRLKEIPKDKPVVVYCRSGARSSQAAGVLTNAGYEAHNLGPMSAW